MKIAVFYHCLFCIGTEPLWSAVKVVHEQMKLLKESGLEDAASEIFIGVNGGKESEVYANNFLPKKAKVVYHGLQCRNENRTLLMMQEWCKSHDDEAVCLYFHSKGASHAIDSPYEKNTSTPWRRRMMKHCIEDWRRCVLDLHSGFEAVGCHWLEGQGWDKSQFFFAGTIYWARASFIRTIPLVTTRQRIKESGIDSPESRFETEVILSIGKRLPFIKNYYSGGIGT
jgi:hypothetical protein